MEGETAGGQADLDRGSEHLRAAAREMLAAARAFLDAVEEVVEDPDRIVQLGQAVGAVAQQAARVGRSTMGAPATTDRSGRPDPGRDDGGESEPLF